MRAAGDRLHHRRLDLEVAAGVEIPPDRSDDQRPRLEDPPRLGIDGEIEVPLPVPLLDVFQAVPLFWKGPEALGEKRDRLRLDRKLSRARPEDPSRNSYPVAEIEGLEEGPGFLPDVVSSDVDLDPFPAVGEVEETRLSLDALRQDPAGRRDLGLFLLEVLAARASVARRDLCGCGIRGELERIDVLRHLRDQQQVIGAILDELRFRRRVRCALWRSPLGRVCHRAESISAPGAAGEKPAARDAGARPARCRA